MGQISILVCPLLQGLCGAWLRKCLFLYLLGGDSPAVKQQISEVAFKIWLKHETFLIYRVLCAESNKIETHFQLYSEKCVNWGYLSASDGNLFCKLHFQLSWPTCFASVNNWSNMNCLRELYISGTISWIVVIWNIFRNILPFPTWQKCNRALLNSVHSHIKVSIM